MSRADFLASPSREDLVVLTVEPQRRDVEPLQVLGESVSENALMHS